MLGYWLGSEFVINSSYRLVAYGKEITLADRSTLMRHIMSADQHVRYALILQATLGVSLCAMLGYVPGGQDLAIGAALGGTLWLAFVEVVHRLQHNRIGAYLSRIDRCSRYLLIGLCLGVAFNFIGEAWPLPRWLQVKITLFAMVMLCGVAIRLCLLTHFRTWKNMQENGSSDVDEIVIRRTYLRATSVLILLWIFIAAIVVTSVLKPF